jgi:hypothetical protein
MANKTYRSFRQYASGQSLSQLTTKTALKTKLHLAKACPKAKIFSNGAGWDGTARL